MTNLEVFEKQEELIKMIHNLKEKKKNKKPCKRLLKYTSNMNNEMK